jgi:hypothetical protein
MNQDQGNRTRPHSRQVCRVMRHSMRCMAHSALLQAYQHSKVSAAGLSTHCLPTPCCPRSRVSVTQLQPLNGTGASNCSQSALNQPASGRATTLPWQRPWQHRTAQQPSLYAARCSCTPQAQPPVHPAVYARCLPRHDAHTQRGQPCSDLYLNVGSLTTCCAAYQGGMR